MVTDAQVEVACQTAMNDQELCAINNRALARMITFGDWLTGFSAYIDQMPLAQDATLATRQGWRDAHNAELQMIRHMTRVTVESIQATQRQSTVHVLSDAECAALTDEYEGLMEFQRDIEFSQRGAW